MSTVCPRETVLFASRGGDQDLNHFGVAVDRGQ
jgi:hypothetical protein